VKSSNKLGVKSIFKSHFHLLARYAKSSDVEYCGEPENSGDPRDSTSHSSDHQTSFLNQKRTHLYANQNSWSHPANFSITSSSCLMLISLC